MSKKITVRPVPDGKMLEKESRKTCHMDKYSFNFREIEVMRSSKKKLSAFVMLAVLAFIACQQNPSKSNSAADDAKPNSVYEPSYANRFRIKYFVDHKRIEVTHPWDSAAAPLITLLSNDARFLKNNPSAIKIPVKRWVSVASTQISYANQLNVLDALVGMAEPQYVSNKKVQEGLATGKVRDIGTAFSPDTEILMALNPDMMMISPFKDDFYAPLRSAGIKMATNSSYLENTPLGRMEWLVYVAAFFNKEDEAVATVKEIAQRYNKVKQLAANANDKPCVMSGQVYQGVWYTPAAQSFNANFLKDAGVHYIFEDRPGTGSLSYDFETVYQAAAGCEYWMLMVNRAEAYSYTALKDEDVRYADFNAFKLRNVVYSNTHNSMIFEKGLLEPDVVLQDLVQLFHPGLNIGLEQVYYRQLTKE